MDQHPGDHPATEKPSPQEVEFEIEVEGNPTSPQRSGFQTKFPSVNATEDERTMAALAHGSILLSLVTGGLAGLLVALIVWLVYRDRSRWVAQQAFQALIYQALVTILTYVLTATTGIAFMVSGILTAILIGLCMFPFAALIAVLTALFALAATIYGLYGAWETYQGRDFQYWWVSDLIREKQWG